MQTRFVGNNKAIAQTLNLLPKNIIFFQVLNDKPFRFRLSSTLAFFFFFSMAQQNNSRGKKTEGN